MQAPKLLERSRGLTDDALTQQRPSRTIPAYLREAIDGLSGADPGLTQLRTGLQALLGISVSLAAVYGFVRVTGALQQSATPGAPAAVAASVSAHNHAVLLVLMLLAGMLAMLSSFAVNDDTVGGQVISMLLLPVPMLATITAGLALGSYRLASLAFLVIVMTGSVYVRRWGQRGFSCGLVAFNGAFLGFFLHSQLALHDVGWLAADLGIGLVASLLIRLSLLRPNPGRTLSRMRHSWRVRAHRLLALCESILSETDEARARRLREQLRRQLVRLNESTLMIDAQLVRTAPGSAAAQAQVLFDTELAVSNCARFTAALGTAHAGPAITAQVRLALHALLTEDWEASDKAATALRHSTTESPRVALLTQRLAASVIGYSAAVQQLDQAVRTNPAAETAEQFRPAVGLTGGYLPGSVPISTAASTTPGRGGLLDSAAMPPYVRASIQIAVASTLAVAIGDLLSGTRLYWAVLATFLSFMATTNSGEQVRKALFRVVGTAIGIVLGDVLVRVTGAHVVSSLAIVLIALFAGIYLIRINYTFMVIGITVTMSQLYAQLGELSWHLLLLRLAETAIGVGAVIVTVLLIVPLRPQRVLTAAVLLWFQPVLALVDAGLDRLAGKASHPLRPLVREADAAYAALEATALPLRRATFGRYSAQLTEIRLVSSAARTYARSFAVEAESADPAPSAALDAAANQFRTSVTAIEHRIATGEHGSYVRAGALFETASRAIGTQDDHLSLALRDLALLDGALARLAAALQMDVVDLDTTPDAWLPDSQSRSLDVGTTSA